MTSYWLFKSEPDVFGYPDLVRNKREGIHDDYTVPNFEAALSRRYDVVRRQELPGGTRICYHATPK